MNLPNARRSAQQKPKFQSALGTTPASPRDLADPGPRNFLDAEYVIYRLEEAGRTLLALPHTGFTTALRRSSIDILASAIQSLGCLEKQVRPAVPPASRITRMDEALTWISLIPDDRYVLRRIVGARSLVSPITERHLFSWRRLGATLGADHKAVQRWHANGIDLIVSALNRLPA